MLNDRARDINPSEKGQNKNFTKSGPKSHK